MNESREKTSRSYDAESVVKKHLEEVAREMARAYIADDLEKMRELAKKLILPLVLAENA